MGITQKVKDWWNHLLKLLSDDYTPPKPRRSKPQDSDESQSEHQRYEVKDNTGQTVASDDSLAGAHQAWKSLTSMEGTIIDTKSGKDVTPEKDDDGQFVVLDADGKQLGSYEDFYQASDAWKELTDSEGKIVDVENKTDVTPRAVDYLSEEQLGKVLSMFGGRNVRDPSSMGIDPDLVKEMAQQINRLPMKVFDIANIAGKGKELPTRTVEINRRKVVIDRVEKEVEIHEPVTERKISKRAVPYPTDDRDDRRIRNSSEIRKVRPRHLAMPYEIVAKKVAKRELFVGEFQEEHVEEQQRDAVKTVTQIVEVPRVEEWSEEVQISEEPRAQLLEGVIDISGSMVIPDIVEALRQRNQTLGGYRYPGTDLEETPNPKINLAVALMTLLIGKHLDDESRYFVRQFAESVGRTYDGTTPLQKAALVTWLVNQKPAGLQGGTNIKVAIDTAARDVRRTASHDDRPEVLIITDGEDAITAEQVYEAVGNDVVLHTVIVNNTNADLRKHSDSYYELHWDGARVTGTEGLDYNRLEKFFDDDVDNDWP